MPNQATVLNMDLTIDSEQSSPDFSIPVHVLGSTIRFKTSSDEIFEVLGRAGDQLVQLAALICKNPGSEIHISINGDPEFRAFMSSRDSGGSRHTLDYTVAYLS